MVALALLMLGVAELGSASHHVRFLAPSGSQLSASAAVAALPQPYRASFHFQPPDNWMNDPNGPMFYKGYYHLFYQWNPYAAVWGNITWGHAVSTDMIRWHILDLALLPDQWYDQYGCWSGSATFLNGKPVLLYTGWSNVSFSRDNQVQMQAMAIAVNYSDPLLRQWTKIPQNPILTAPDGINSTKFRDPTTGWLGKDDKWRMIVGAKRKHRGLAILYRSSDFVQWEKAKHPLHSVARTGMWECPDFYPMLASASRNGIDTSVTGPHVKHVLKVSLDDTKHDYYAVGTYVTGNDSFIPTNAKLDAGLGLRYDYGKYYASKTFFDDNKGRRILLGWVNESSIESADIAKNWSSMQGFPRIVWLDAENSERILQWPIDEIKSLYKQKNTLESMRLDIGPVVKVKTTNGAQLDIEVDFALPELKQAEKLEVNASSAQQLCSERASSRSGLVGPFGLLVLASEDQSEQTAVFFYIVSDGRGSWNALVCSDQSRSSLSTDPDKTAYGSFIPVFGNETTMSLRVLVDHSIVETFAQGGKVCITSRVYPTKAINEEAQVYVFNNGSVPIQLKKLTAWEMETVDIGPF
ncbi:hypothetical protein GOP47_0016539 [Adiantum capillus-veneris]|nr:hypothetical protein GOP47_0016539 [Adiantum capillus-veneris]